MPDPATPTVWRHWLADELRSLREDASRTLDEVAEVLQCSRAKVSRIELGQVGVRPLEVEAMLSFYGVSPEKRQQLVQFAAEARRKGWWWHEFRDLDQEPASKHMEYVDYEIAATSIQTYQTIVLGLFQTADYARAVVRAVRLDLSDDEIERHVAFRMRRQRLLDQDELPELWVVLDEGVLYRRVGGHKTMQRQLERLLEVADHPKVHLQVLPFDAGEHAGIDGGFTILGYSGLGSAGTSDRDMIVLENALSDQFLRESIAVRRYLAMFEAICQAAYGSDRSKELIAEVGKRM